MSPLPPPELPESTVASEVQDACAVLGLEAEAARLDREPAFPAAVFRELGRRHLLGLVTSSEHGGRGLPLHDAGRALYELARASGATTFAKLSLQPEFCSVLADQGGEELRREWFEPVCRGERLVGNQITEPGAGSDARAIAVRADPIGSGYRISGTKSEIAFATDADAALLYVRVPEGPDGPGGITAFLVDQRAPGVARSIVPDLGERWMRRGTVRYEDVVVSSSRRLGPVGRGLELVLPELHRERGLLAMIYLGVARRSLEETVAHVGSREAFGKPLAQQEAIGFVLARDWAELGAATLFTDRALREAERTGGTPAAPAMAKFLAVETALRIHDHALQFHGGRGYSTALPFERRWRDARSGALAHGSSEIMQLTAARSFWGRPA